MDEQSLFVERRGESPTPPEFDYDAWGESPDGEIRHKRYGYWWPLAKGIDEIFIELECFRVGRSPEDGGLGKVGHLREVIDLLWNSGRKKHVDWNPWMERMLDAACETNFLGVAGCSSSSKSFTGAIWAIVNWLCDPENTLCLVTSTSVKAAKGRIWKSVIQLWNALPPKWRKKGKLKPTQNMIHYQPPDDSVAPDSSAIQLIAAEQKQEATAVTKLIGLKNQRVLLIADELSELSHSVVAATDNLISNPYFHMTGMSNPKDPTDPFGVFCEPVNGWGSIDESCMEWDSKLGKVIRFDVLQSPNYIERETIYSYMYTYEKIERMRQHLGENSARFYRFYRGYFPIQGAEDVIYSDVDFIAFVKEQVQWSGTPIKVAGLDLSSSSGGDRTMMVIGLFGTDNGGRQCLQYVKAIHIKTDATNKMVGHTEQVCQEVKKILEIEGIEHGNLAVDNSGAGIPQAEWLVQVLSPHLLRVNFGGKASERPVSANDQTPAHKRYVNRVSELWHCGIEFMRGGQFAGLNSDTDLVAEMKCRHYETKKGADGERVQVEPKKEMKARMGRSPDTADAFMLMLELCRHKHHFRSQERGLAVLPQKDYYEQLRRLDLVTLSSGGMPDWMPMAG